MIGVKGNIIIFGEYFNLNEYGIILISYLNYYVFFFIFELKYLIYYFNVLFEKECIVKYEKKWLLY